MKNYLMQRSSKHILSVAMGVGMLMVMMIGNGGMALAATTPGFTVTAGTLTGDMGTPVIKVGVNPIGSNNPLTLNGTKQTIGIDLPISINNSTGGAWTLSLSATRFSVGAFSLTNLPLVPTTNEVAPVDSTSGNVPDYTNTTPTSLPEYAIDGTPLQLFSGTAVDHQGMGTYQTTIKMTLDIAAKDYAKNYSSTFYMDTVIVPGS